MRPDSPEPAPSPWAELVRTVPSTVLLGLVAGVFGWGVAYKGFTASLDAQADRIGRLEAKQAADLSELKLALTTRFDALDRRGDGRMADIRNRADAADKRDEQISGELTALNLRLTRLEAAREFVNANGPGETARPAPGAGGARR